MGSISFKRAAEDEWRIYDHDGDCVGDVYRLPDIGEQGAPVYLVHLSEDPRGWTRVHDRSRVRDVAERQLATHPLYR